MSFLAKIFNHQNSSRHFRSPIIDNYETKFSDSSSLEALFPLSDFQQTMNSAAAILLDIDLDAAIATHKDWRLQLHSYITEASHEEIKPEIIGLDHQCALGKWLHGSGKEQLGSHQSFVMLVAQHMRFHTEAAQVVALANAKKFAMASERLNKNFAYAGRQLDWLLQNLKTNLQFMDTPAPNPA
jgi:hypothetical protein